MKRFLTILVLGSLFAASSAEAQTTASQFARITIPQLLFVQFTGDVNFPSPTLAEMQAGVTNTQGGFTLDHLGNQPYDITVEADQTTFDFNGGAGTKAAGDLEYDMDGAGMVSMPVVPVTLLDEEGPGFGSNAFEFRLLLDATNDVPGDYELPFTFTILVD